MECAPDYAGAIMPGTPDVLFRGRTAMSTYFAGIPTYSHFGDTTLHNACRSCTRLLRDKCTGVTDADEQICPILDGGVQ